MGGGVAQIVMPLLLTALLSLGIGEALSWRLAMVVPGIALLLYGVAYYRLTQDTPQGNYDDLRRAGQIQPSGTAAAVALLQAARDSRVLALFVVYGACFGLQLTINNVAALYYYDRFGLSVPMAGLLAGLFGLTNLFARTLGGVLADRVGIRFGLQGRVAFLGAILLAEGLGLILFSQMGLLLLAVAAMVVCSVFVQMAAGATYAVVPFVSLRSPGAVAGIVAAGGNVGAVAASSLFLIEGLAPERVFLLLGVAVAAISALALVLRFSKEEHREERTAMGLALQPAGAFSSDPERMGFRPTV
jgi:NNP family nitrate/nitrite transporter-like MFS transporter